MGSTIWQICQSALIEFCNSCPGLLVKDVFDMNIVFLQETSIKGNLVDKEERTKNKNKNLPDNIVRHQFLSLLVRIAKDKYVTRCNTVILILCSENLQ